MRFLSKLKLAGLFMLGLLFALFTLTTNVNANTTLTQLPFYWNAINVVIDVQSNGDMLVTETQEYVFNREHSNQRYRYIPLNKVDDITDVTVSENNKIIPSQVGKKNNQLWIKWQHELNPPESHTFAIKYRVIGGLPVTSHTAQVYWKAIFGDRSAPIQNAKVTVKLPKSVAGKIYSYNSYPNSIPVSAQKLDEQTIEFIAQKSIPQGQELEVQVRFPNDVLNIQKSQWQRSEQQKVSSRQRNNGDTNIIGIIYSLILAALIVWAMISGSSNNSSSRSRSSRSRGGYGGGGGGGG